MPVGCRSVLLSTWENNVRAAPCPRRPCSAKHLCYCQLQPTPRLPPALAGGSGRQTRLFEPAFSRLLSGLQTPRSLRLLKPCREAGCTVSYPISVPPVETGGRRGGVWRPTESSRL